MSYFKKSKDKGNQTDNQFAQDWGEMMPSIIKLKWVAQFFSGLTEAIAIHTVLISNLKIANQFLLIGLSVTLTIAVVVFIEIIVLNGIAPSIFANIIKKRFSTRNIVMMLSAGSFVAFALVASPTLSNYGSDEMVETFTEEVKSADEELAGLNDDNNTLILSAKSDAREDKKTFDVSLNNQKLSIINKFSARQDNVNTELERLAKIKASWAKGHIPIQKKKLASIKEEQSKELEQLEQVRINKYNEIDSVLNTTILGYNTQRDEIAKITKDDNKDDKDSRSSKVGLWGGLWGKFAIACSLIAVLCIIIIMVYVVNSGHAKDGEIFKTKPSIIRQRLKGILKGIYLQVARLLSWFEKWVTPASANDTSDANDNTGVNIPDVYTREPTIGFNKNHPINVNANDKAQHVDTLSLDAITSNDKNAKNPTIVYVDRIVEKIVEKPVIVEKIIEKNAKEKTKPCENCNKEFTFKRPSKRFCSTKCRMAKWEQKNGKTLKRGKKNLE